MKMKIDSIFHMRIVDCITCSCSVRLVVKFEVIIWPRQDITLITQTLNKFSILLHFSLYFGLLKTRLSFYESYFILKEKRLSQLVCSDKSLKWLSDKKHIKNKKYILISMKCLPNNQCINWFVICVCLFL